MPSTNMLSNTTMDTGEYEKMYLVEEKLWWYRRLRDILMFYLQRYAPQRAKILDAGCGTGMNMLYLQSLGYKVYGIDVSAQAVSYAKKRGLTNVQKGSIIHISFPDNTFDVVMSMDVIGLLDDDSVKKAFDENYRVLKSGGLLMVHTAAFEWLRSQHDDVSHVKKRYAKKQLVALFSSKKWDIQKVSYRMFFLFVPLALVKLMKRPLRFKDPQGDLYLPPPLLNSLLYAIQKLENILLRYTTFPFGTSLFLIARKK